MCIFLYDGLIDVGDRVPPYTGKLGYHFLLALALFFGRHGSDNQVRCNFCEFLFAKNLSIYLKSSITKIGMMRKTTMTSQQ